MQENLYMDFDPESALKVAVKAAQRAGNFLQKAQKSEVIIDKNSRRDVKLAVDRQSERIIIEELSQKSDFSILTEERGILLEKERGQRFRWVVDPLDGSLNFLNHIPLCCVSIALWQENEPVLGVIYDFNREEIFTGIVGRGAWLNNIPLQVSAAPMAEQAILCTGFPVATDFSSQALLRFVDQIRVYKKIRLFGSAALSLAYVAAGKTDAYFEKDIKLWDVAAGMAIVKAAGGEFICTEHNKKYMLSLFAGNSNLIQPGIL